MSQHDATVQYYTHHYRTCSSQQLRHALALGLPWPEHMAAQAILRERAATPGESPNGRGSGSPSLSKVIRRILGSFVLLALRAFTSARANPPRRTSQILNSTAISSVKILGNIPSSPIRTAARVGERPHKVSA